MDTPNFEDLTKWEVKDGVTVFDEHEERGAKGNLLREFKRRDLDAIVEQCNERDAGGAFCPLMLGHTEDGKPETAQPPIVGYARHFGVEWSDVLKRWVIRCKYFIKKERLDEAREYPRTSVELWAKEKFFDPISLLKRTPQRDRLPQWTYVANGKKLRYAMDEKEDDKDKDKEDETEKKFAKFKRKFARRYAKFPEHHSGMTQYARKFRKFLKKYQGQPSGTDTFVPGGPEKKAKGEQLKPVIAQTGAEVDMNKSEEKRIRDDQAAIERAQYQKRIEELEKKDKERDATQTRYRREGELKQLLMEGLRLDVADELQLCEGMSDEQFIQHKARIKKCYMKNPPGELIRIHQGRVEAGELPDETTSEQHDEAMREAQSDKYAKLPASQRYDAAMADIKKKSKAG